jgi:hypothetical protein
MSVPARLGLFGALLAGVFGLALLVGSLAGPEAQTAQRPAHGTESLLHGEAAGKHAAGAGTAAAEPGLAVARDGLRLVLEQPMLARERRAEVRFTIVDDAGDAVRDFDLAHEKRMHLILVRRDLAGFQHLHPEQGPDGSWAASADLSLGGTWRVFADFTRDGEQQTLGTDLQVPGMFRPVELEAPATTARTESGLEVRLRRDGPRVEFAVQRDGRDVTAQLDAYLGAKGHLVTLRTGDLVYLHTHPEGDELAFETELPTDGAYRLWVQFQLDGRVHTAAFTQEVTS